MFEGLSIDFSKAFFALSALFCSIVVHNHIAHRIGIPFRQVVLSKSFPTQTAPRASGGAGAFRKVDDRRFGDRVILGELFSILTLSVGTFLLFDSVIDFFPSFDTESLAVWLVLGDINEDPELTKIAHELIPFTIGIAGYLALFTFAAIFYIFNSERVSDKISTKDPRNLGASLGPKVPVAPNMSIGGNNQVNQSTEINAITAGNDGAEDAIRSVGLKQEFSHAEFQAAHDKVLARAASAGMSLPEFCETEIYRRNSLPVPEKGDGTEAKILLETLLRE